MRNPLKTLFNISFKADKIENGKVIGLRFPQNTLSLYEYSQSNFNRKLTEN